jgi:hypothetical protein
MRFVLFRSILFLCVIVSSLSAGAQEKALLHGQVLSSEGDTLTGAIVSCIHLPDSMVIAHSVTDMNGKFSFDQSATRLEDLLLEVSYMGYKKCYLKPEGGEMTITLSPSAISLGEVVIKTSRSSLKQKPGMFIYTPGVSEAKSLDSYDLLRFTPLITLEGNAVSILGKGTSTLYINGRKPVMDNAALMEMLRSTPASQIDKIEIITAPNSSYKASVTGGIINVMMKKNPNQGLTGSASVSGTYRGERLSPRSSLYLGYSRDKFNASANFDFSDTRSLDVTEVLYNYKSTFTEIANSNRLRSRITSLNGNASMTYDFTPKSTAGASFHVGDAYSKSSSTIKTTNRVKGIVDHLSSTTDKFRNPFKSPEVGMVAYYNLKTDDKGSNLDVSADYSRSLNSTSGDMEYAKGMDFSQLTPYSLFQQNSKVNSYGYEFATKYNHHFDDDNVVEGGYEFDASHIANDFKRNDYDGGQYVANKVLSNNFLYDEKINALYLTYDRTWGDAFSTTIGLRTENTAIDGNQKTSGETFHRNYWNFFPQLSLLLDLANGNHSLSLDFSRSITRPFYNNLNPFKIWTSETTYSMGNIFVKPMIFTDVDFKYTLLRDYILGISYSYGSDAFSEYTYTANDNTTVSSLANFGSEQTLSFYVNLHKIFLNGLWRMMINAEADYDKVDGTIDGLDAGYKKWSANMEIRNIFYLSQKKGITGTVSYNYYTPSRSIYKVGHDKHLLNFSIRKQFKFGGTLSLDVLNLLNYTPSYHYDAEDYSYKDTPHTNNISVQLKFAMKFGQSKVRGARDRSATKHLERFEK